MVIHGQFEGFTLSDIDIDIDSGSLGVKLDGTEQISLPSQK